MLLYIYAPDSSIPSKKLGTGTGVPGFLFFPTGTGTGSPVSGFQFPSSNSPLIFDCPSKNPQKPHKRTLKPNKKPKETRKPKNLDQP